MKIKSNKPIISYSKSIVITLIVLLFFNTITVNASKINFNQKIKISLSQKKVSLGHIIDEIESKTEYKFYFVTNTIDLNRSVTLEKDEATIEDILKDVLKESNISYTVDNFKIVLKKANTKVAITKVVKGKVTDEEGIPLPSANIYVKGSKRGTFSDFNGNFELIIPNQDNVILVISYQGFLTQEIPITDQTDISTKVNVIMKRDSYNLNAVVVTALNVERQQKSIGFATQKVDGKEIAEAHETNLLSSLSGKIAGAQVTNTNGAVGSSSTIVLRGYSSINGNVQPLFVIDGVPISNEVHQSSRASIRSGNPNNSGFLGEGEFSDEIGGEQQVDYGNAAAEINPQDIESIQVLKGGTAAALYGARAANGVILITTKNGKNKKGLGISINSSTSLEDPLKTPKFQTTFGKGRNGIYRFNPNEDNGVARNFGPRFNGQIIPQYDPNNPEVARNIPWVNRLGEDPIGDFLRTGVTKNYGISITNGGEKGNFRFSYNRLDQEGMVPNTDLTRNSFNLNVNYELSKKLQFSSSANYIQSGSDNRPEIGAKNQSNIIYTLLRTGTNESLGELQNFWEPGREGEQQATSDSQVNNPYFLVNENLNGNSRNRFFGNVALKYSPIKDLSIQFRTGKDFYRDLRTSRKAFSHFPYTRGFYSEANVVYNEENTDILVNYAKNVGDFSFKALGGANRLNIEIEELRANTQSDGLVIPNFYNLSNSASPVQASNFKSIKRINSIYGGLTVGYNDYLFLDLTARNDWSSALPLKNNSFFYPSASVSAVVSEMFNFKPTSSSDYIKLRGSYAEVGNDTDPYQTNAINITGTTVENQTINTLTSNIGNTELEPENIASYETGIEASFFKNRFQFDVTYYTSENDKQIVTVPLATETGFLTRTINIPATITNKGLEISTTIIPLKTSNFSWETNINWAKNENKISNFITLDDNERLTLAERWINLDITNGGSFGDFYGDYLLKVDENGVLGRNGTQIFREDGRAEESDDVGSLVDEAKPLLGNAIPDWTAGINNTFTYKNVSFSFLLDINKGGQVHSRTFVVGNNFGSLQESTEVFERDNPEAAIQAASQGIDVNQGEQFVTLDGAFLNKNTGETTDANFAARTDNVNKRYFDNDAIGTFDRTFVKLREVKLTYRIPKKPLEALSIQNASISLFGRNLLLWDNLPHIDPEAAGYSGELPGGEFFAIPSARSIGFSFNATF